MYGMRPQAPSEPDVYIGKLWKLLCTNAEVAAALERRCDGSHRHVTVEGSETAGTAFYPPALTEKVHKTLGDLFS